MHVLLAIIHIIAAILLILIILLQQSKGGGLAGLFGGSSGMEDILSSPSGNVFLKKATITLAVIFFTTSLVLAVRTSREGMKSIFQKRPAPIQAPVTPSPKTPQSE